MYQSTNQPNHKEFIMQPCIESLKRQFDYRDGGLYRLSTCKRGYLRSDGYVYTRIDGMQFGEHRLIYFMFTGEWPKWPSQIDHVNRERGDNRIENLRLATHAENCSNRTSTARHSKGCYWQEKRQKWMVQVSINGKRKTIGYFACLDEAKEAFKQAARKSYGEFAD